MKRPLATLIGIKRVHRKGREAFVRYVLSRDLAPIWDDLPRTKDGAVIWAGDK